MARILVTGYLCPIPTFARAFQRPGSVLGARCPALPVSCILYRASCILHTPCAGFRSVSQAFRLIARLPCRVPGTRHLGPDTWHRKLLPVTRHSITPSLRFASDPRRSVPRAREALDAARSALFHGRPLTRPDPGCILKAEGARSLPALNRTIGRLQFVEKCLLIAPQWD
jgi:hypothetical protein